MEKCRYRFCQIQVDPSIKKFCCDNHRTAEWSLLHPRVRKDESKSTPLTVGWMDLPHKDVKFLQVSISDKPKRSFHFSSINQDNKRGKILRKTLELLMKTNPTTRQINEFSGSTRSSSDISELRAQGFLIDCIKGEVNRFQLTVDGREKAEKFLKR